MTTHYSIITATQNDFNNWLNLTLKLWPNSSIAEMQQTLTTILQSPHQTSFLVKTNQGETIGFMHLSLRQDYVAGATQSPVAFVEGIYIKTAHRQQGIGTALIQQAEQWALTQNCTELASDALIENTTSYAFHTNIGFQEVERVVCFIKPILAPSQHPTEINHQNTIRPQPQS